MMITGTASLSARCQCRLILDPAPGRRASLRPGNSGPTPSPGPRVTGATGQAPSDSDSGPGLAGRGGRGARPLPVRPPHPGHLAHRTTATDPPGGDSESESQCRSRASQPR
jgi:hypothetical protein